MLPKGSGLARKVYDIGSVGWFWWFWGVSGLAAFSFCLCGEMAGPGKFRVGSWGILGISGLALGVLALVLEAWCGLVPGASGLVLAFFQGGGGGEVTWGRGEVARAWAIAAAGAGRRARSARASGGHRQNSGGGRNRKYSRDSFHPGASRSSFFSAWKQKPFKYKEKPYWFNVKFC